MGFSIFLNFAGDCNQALDFYSKAFGQKINDKMTYADAPPTPGYVLPEGDKNLIMFASINIQGCEVMFMDMPGGAQLTKGNNIAPSISFDTTEEMLRVFAALKEGGSVETEPEQNFFAKLYASVLDKYGIWWHLLVNA